MAADFMAAVIGVLNADPDVVAAFNSSSTHPKFQSIQNFKANLPFARLLEVASDDMFQSGPTSAVLYYFERGILQVDVFDVSERSARANGRLIARALNDAELSFDDGGNLELRQSRRFFVPEPDSGTAGTAVVFHYIVEFTYMNQYPI
jgi:hypothetical protein